MTNTQITLLARAVGLVVGVLATPTITRAADALLTGAVTSSAGETLEGVTVSAKQEGSTIATSVYTDEAGGYFFPPMPSGKYQVWAQALGFETTKSQIEVAATRRANLVLQPMTNQERRIRQLPAELLVAALPEESDDDVRIKKVVTNQCAGCHSPGYALQFRFDETGWNKVITLMETLPLGGTKPNGFKSNPLIEFNQRELAAYLARARGPSDSSMKLPARRRPVGEAARVVWTLYDLPLNPDLGLGTKYNTNDGTDWSLGTTSRIGQLPHDGGMGLDGNLYYTVNARNRNVSIGKVDGKTGEVTYLKVNANNGNAANTHGLTRDAEGNFWFDINPGRQGLGKLDVKTERITIYQTPPNISPLGGAVTTDIDGNGKIWASAPDGVLQFDPVTEQFTAFKSTIPYQDKMGTNVTYGAAGDRDGNGWWAQMVFDTIGHADLATGKVTEIKLPPLKVALDRLSPEARSFYENFDDRSVNNPLPWNQGPRRMSTDKNGDVLWVANSWGGSLARINTKTFETAIIQSPSSTMQPYHVTVDNGHNVWINLWTSDYIARYDPSDGNWITFDLPVRGTEIRHISLMEREGVTKVIVPIYRSSQMGVMTLRSEAELVALKAQAQ